MTYTLDWSETNLGGSAVVSYAAGAVLDFVDKPAGATSALSLAAHQTHGTDHILVEFEIETTGSSVLTFDYKISTESGWDELFIDVDGVSQVDYSGVIAWTSHPGISIPTAGVHNIRFRYTKDAGGNANDDRVWIANLNVTNTVTVNDGGGFTYDTSDMEDGSIPAVASTTDWTNSTSEPIAGSRSLRTPAAPAHSGSYDLEVTKPAGSGYEIVAFDYKVDSESGWDKLYVFPDASVAPATGPPSGNGTPGWIDYSGSASGRLALILPPAATTILFRYAKDGSGSVGSDAAWIDNLAMPAAAASTPSGSGSGTLHITGSGTGSAPVVPPASGSGGGIVGITGSGTGSAPTLSPNAGSGSGSVAILGSGTGSAPVAGSGSGVLHLTGSGSGSAPRSGTGSGTLALTGSGTGSTAHAGTGSGLLAITGSGAGNAPTLGTPTGSGSGVLHLTGSGTGSAPLVEGATGTGSGTLHLFGSGTGATRHYGTGTGLLALTGSGTGRDPSAATRDIRVIAVGAPTSALTTTSPARKIYGETEPTSALTTAAPGVSWTTAEPNL